VGQLYRRVLRISLIALAALVLVLWDRPKEGVHRLGAAVLLRC
jgi:hypothetical protein